MNIIKKIIIFAFLLNSVIIANSQTLKLDSLYNILKVAKQDTTKARLYIEIGYQYNAVNPDTAIFFYNKTIEIVKSKIKDTYFKYLYAKALQSIGWEYINFIGNNDTAKVVLERAFNIYKGIESDKKLESKTQKGIASCLSYMGLILSDKGNYDKAIEFYSKSLKIFEKFNDKKRIASSYGNIGNIYWKKGQFDRAIEYFIKSLKISEITGDKNGIAQCYASIGNIHLEQMNYNKAIEYFNKSLKIKEELGDQKSISICYNNLCIIYKDMGNYKKAMDFCLKALKIGKETGDKEGISACYGNLGNIYSKQKYYAKAIDCYLKTVEINKEIGNINGLSIVYGNIASLHISIADSVSLSFTEKQYHYREAINYGLKAIKIAQEIKATLRINEAAAYLKDVYTAIGNSSKALEYADIYIATKDSMFGEEKTKALAEMETKYQSEKKQLQIEKLGKQKELDKQTIIAKTAENRKQRILITSFVTGFILIVIFSVMLFRLFLQKKKANILLAQQNTEIIQQKEELSTQRDEIEAQRDEIEAQRDLVTNQKEHIEEIHKEVTDSINYAKRIQEAVLPVSDEARSVLGEHFILFKPKDIVSGDFYWTAKIYNGVCPIVVIAVADCTGHGVPGAFMSMLGISFLNEIVQKQEINKANQILNHLRVEIINALQQKGVQGEQKDGMDISLLVVNSETKECQWAGANNPLYIVSSRQETLCSQLPNNCQLSSADYSLFEVKGDKMPIAIHPVMSDFTNHQFKAEKGDCLYLFSDGFADQFGGPKGKKFMYKQFKELLLTNCQKSMIEQKNILEKTINEWINNNEQVDDITILGIKI